MTATTTLVSRYALPPAEIEERSLDLIRRALGTAFPAGPAGEVVCRMVYAAGDPGLAALVRVHPRAVEEGLAALRTHAPIVVDVRMVEVAIDHVRAAALGSAVFCAIANPAV